MHAGSARMSLSRDFAVGAIALLAVAAIGFEHLAYPFSGDQALFMMGAIKMHQGAALYRDFWDLKQPGIYVFYLVAGLSFGFTERGIHLFELVYFLAFSLALQVLLRGHFRYRWASAVLPVLIAGLYYANAVGVTVLTQVEALAAFPIFLSLWCALEGFSKRRPWCLAAAGIFGAIVLAFKLLFLPIVLGIWAVALAAAVAHRRGFDRGDVFAALLLLFSFWFGTAVWLFALVRSAGAAVVYQTFIADPAWIARSVPPAPKSRIVESAGGYAAGVLPLILLAACALRRNAFRNTLWLASLAWLASGLLVISLQRQSWWGYQMQLLTAPLGILAAFGLEGTWDWATRATGVSRHLRFIAGSIVLLLSTTMPVRHVISTSVAFVRSGFAANAEGRERFAQTIEPQIPGIIDETSFLRDPRALSGAIYVFGNPVYYLFTQRTQNVAVNGEDFELLPPEHWAELRKELLQSPPAYLFIERDYRELIRGSELAPMIAAHYRLVRNDPDGDWYVRSGA
jgi:hypothetical protein